MSAKILASTLIGCCLLAPVTAAETIEIPVGQQGEQSVDKPARGINSVQVEAVYGSPISKSGPTGSPPISTWEYPEYTVYFEGDIVIHSVLKHESQE